jgi:hypothetical protein
MQTQGDPTAAYVIVQGSDGTPVAVPAQAGGPMIELSGTPVYNQTGASGTSAVPPHTVVSILQYITLLCSIQIGSTLRNFISRHQKKAFVD